jgi:hypothetical protein
VNTGWTVAIKFPEGARIPLLSSGYQGLKYVSGNFALPIPFTAI